MLISLIASLLCLFLGIYGMCWILGGATLANRFARGIGNVLRLGVRRIGRGTGRAAITFPVVAGIIVLILILMALSRF